MRSVFYAAAVICLGYVPIPSLARTADISAARTSSTTGLRFDTSSNRIERFGSEANNRIPAPEFIFPPDGVFYIRFPSYAKSLTFHCAIGDADDAAFRVRISTSVPGQEQDFPEIDPSRDTDGNLDLTFTKLNRPNASQINVVISRVKGGSPNGWSLKRCKVTY